MKLFIELRDDENTLCKDAELKSDTQPTIKQIEDKIKTIFKIDNEYQMIFHDGNHIIPSVLETFKFEDKMVIVVKHAEIEWWPQYKEAVEIAIKPGDERMPNVREAVTLHEKLMKSGFFYVYSRFHKFRTEYHHQVASWADGNISLMRKAAKRHFRAQHYLLGAKDEFDFTFHGEKAKNSGTHKSLDVYVKLHGEEEVTKYYVKCHHFESSSRNSQVHPPDIKELFIYKLLELIDVGPCAQFIIPDAFIKSKTSIYVCTKWRNDFVSLADLKEENDINVESLLQLIFLGTFLFLGDLNYDNCGQWGQTRKPAIIDFMPRAYSTYTNVKKALLEDNFSIYWKQVHIDLLNKCDEQMRLKIARECFNEWNLLQQIDLTNEQIKTEKDKMEKQEIGFRGCNSPTDELDQYISAVKTNLQKLAEILEKE